MTAPTTHMDRRLQLIAHLYEEEIEGLEPLDRLLEDPDLRQEYTLLRESRFALDHRARVRPDPASIDAIVAAARPAKADSPLRLVRMRRVLVPAMAAAAALLFVFVRLPADDSDVLQNAAPREEVASAESLLRTLPPAAPEPAPPALADVADAGLEAEAVGALPSWDSGRDLRRLSRRIATLKAAGVEDWDEEAVPLEMLPTESGDRTLVPVGANRPGN